MPIQVGFYRFVARTFQVIWLAYLLVLHFTLIGIQQGQILTKLGQETCTRATSKFYVIRRKAEGRGLYLKVLTQNYGVLTGVPTAAWAAIENLQQRSRGDPPPSLLPGEGWTMSVVPILDT